MFLSLSTLICIGATINLCKALEFHCKQIQVLCTASYQVPVNSDCNLFCYLLKARVTGLDNNNVHTPGTRDNDACQGDDGFGQQTLTYTEEPCYLCGTNKYCICRLGMKAWRVHKEDPPNVSCAPQAYANRVCGARTFTPNFAGLKQIVASGQVTNGNVHCSTIQ